MSSTVHNLCLNKPSEGSMSTTPWDYNRAPLQLGKKTLQISFRAILPFEEVQLQVERCSSPRKEYCIKVLDKNFTIKDIEIFKGYAIDKTNWNSTYLVLYKV